MSARDGGAAFPRPHSWDQSPFNGYTSGDLAAPHPEQDGMTLRDYFAAAVMQGLAVGHGMANENPDQTRARFAHAAYATADAMLEVRK